MEEGADGRKVDSWEGARRGAGAGAAPRAALDVKQRRSEGEAVTASRCASRPTLRATSAIVPGRLPGCLVPEADAVGAALPRYATDYR